MNINSTTSEPAMGHHEERPTTKGRSAEEWNTQVSEWESSGLSQKEFCKQRHLKYHLFHYYRSKRSKKKGVEKLLPIQLLGQKNREEISSKGGYVLGLPNGGRLSIPLNYDAASLKGLLHLLGAC